MVKEFKAFVMRGNVLDLAVAFVMGAAFTAVVQSFAGDVLMNLVAAIFGEPSFEELTLTVGDGTIAYGSFLTALLNFLIVAFGMFMIVKVANRLHRKPEETPTTRPCPFCLTQIPREATRCSACTSEVEAQVA